MLIKTGDTVEVIAGADKEVAITLATATEEAQRTRGQGDAQRTRIFADAGATSSKLTFTGWPLRPWLSSIVIIRDLLVMVRTCPRTRCERGGPA